VPNSHPDEAPVTWGRWQEAHQALLARVTRLEAALGALGDPAATHQRLQEEIDRLREGGEHRRNRAWTLVTLCLAGVAAPILVALITVGLHIGSAH